MGLPDVSLPGRTTSAGELALLPGYPVRRHGLDDRAPATLTEKIGPAQRGTAPRGQTHAGTALCKRVSTRSRLRIEERYRQRKRG
jgi:hypothetical protein